METPEEFEKASHRRGASLVKEFLQFVVENKAWWLIPILVCLGGARNPRRFEFDRRRTVHLYPLLMPGKFVGENLQFLRQFAFDQSS